MMEIREKWNSLFSLFDDYLMIFVIKMAHTGRYSELTEDAVEIWTMFLLYCHSIYY